MGAWGINNFENDDALDWLNDYEDEPAEATLYEAFGSVNEIGDEYLEAPESAAALAAAEIIAAIKGFPSSDLPDDAREIIKNSSIDLSDNLISEALKAVLRVKSDSELKELVEETDKFSDWNKVVDDLVERLRK